MKALALLILVIFVALLSPSQELGIYRPGARQIGGRSTGATREPLGTIQVKHNGATARVFTIAALNSYSLQAGDSVLFQKGQTYRGQVNASTANVYYGSHGTGADPIISGAEVLTGWVSRGSYYATKASQDVGDLWIGGVQQVMARFPNTGFLTVDATNGSTRVTSSGMTQDSGYWVGGTIRYKPSAYAWESGTISGFWSTGDSVKFGTSSHTVKADYGFYLEGVYAALDTANEWYANTSTDSVYVYADPSSSVVEASVYEYGVKVTASNVTVSGLNFRHQLKAGIRIMGTVGGLNIANCDISYQRWDGIYSSDTTTASKIDACTFRDVPGNGIFFAKGSTDTVNGCTFDNIGMVSGKGMRSNSYMVNATAILFKDTTSSCVVSGNTIDSVGYIGIGMYGANQVVKQNVLTNLMLHYSDGGALYSYSEDPSKSYGTLWQNNIVDGVTGSVEACPVGTDISAHGLYWDHGSQKMRAEYNTIANVSGKGVFQSMGAHHDTLYHNVIYNVGTGNGSATGGIMLYVEDTTSTNANCYVGNQIYVDSTKTNVAGLYVQADYVEAEFPKATLGTIDSNYYYEETSSIIQKLFHDETWQLTNYTLASWVTFSSQDSHSVGRVAYYRPQFDSVVIYQNRSDTTYTPTFSGGTHRTLAGDSATSVALDPYSSAMFLFIDTTVVRDTIDANNRDGNSKAVGTDERLVGPDNASNFVGNSATSGLLWVGFQFKLWIPQGATVDSAIISHRYQGVTNGTWGTGDSLVWCIYDTTDCPVFVEEHEHELTTHAPFGPDSIAFSPTIPASGYFDSPNLATLLQHVVDRVDWVPGGYVGFVVGPRTVGSGDTFNLGDYNYNSGEIAARIRVFFH